MKLEDAKKLRAGDIVHEKYGLDKKVHLKVTGHHNWYSSMDATVMVHCTPVNPSLVKGPLWKDTNTRDIDCRFLERVVIKDDD